MMFDGLGSSATHIKGGRIKALAVAADKRAPGFPDVPTTAEVRRARPTRWPPGTACGRPRARRRTWSSACRPRCARRSNSDELQGHLDRPGRRARPTCTARPSASFVSSEIKRWAEVVKASGAKLRLSDGPRMQRCNMTTTSQPLRRAARGLPGRPGRDRDRDRRRRRRAAVLHLARPRARHGDAGQPAARRWSCPPARASRCRPRRASRR